MYEEEIIVFAFSCFIAAVYWTRWYLRALRPSTLVSTMRTRSIMLLSPPVCLVALFAVLRSFSAHDVHESAPYLLMYMAIGAAALAIFSGLLSTIGVHPHDDVVQRRNLAAGYASAGAMLGATLCFAGANIGDGPGWWVVLFCALLSLGAFLALLVGLEKLTGWIEVVSVDRRASTGLRLCGFAIGVGLILGRSVAGDWQSAGATVGDFASTAWPALALSFLELVLARVESAAPEARLKRFSFAGALGGALYVGLAVAYLSWLGWWS
jgi:uncharacterized membrane protein YjfL (UPF0719 family)